MLHDSVSLKLGHGKPPYAETTVTLLVRVCVPLAQVTVQALKSDQADTTQSIGQGCVLHDSVSIRIGHTEPPYASWITTVRVRTCEPPPQITVQELKSDQAETMQSTGHGCVLQDSVSLKLGHAVPP